MSKKLIVSAITILVLLTTQSTANAGFFDWIKKDNQSTYLTANSESAWSINKVSDSMKNNEEKEVAPKAMTIQNSVSETGPVNTPSTKKSGPKKVTVVATAYSSTVDQTDDSPFITASGSHVRDGIVAANFLPFGTRIKIPDVFGDKIFVVEDRMNKRYWHRVDIWFPERSDAMTFGIKTITIEIIS